MSSQPQKKTKYIVRERKLYSLACWNDEIFSHGLLSERKLNSKFYIDNVIHDPCNFNQIIWKPQHDIAFISFIRNINSADISSDLIAAGHIISTLAVKCKAINSLTSARQVDVYPGWRIIHLCSAVFTLPLVTRRSKPQVGELLLRVSCPPTQLTLFRQSS